MSSEYKDWYSDLSEKQKKNYELCMKYPFLIPTNRWTGEEVGDYEYEYTELDAMPDGWRIAFGEQLCEELKEELVKENCLYEYGIAQIKEKYGRLCWYDWGNTENGLKIIRKYEDMSETTCIKCGKPANGISQGWISPFCNECAEKYQIDIVPINQIHTSQEGE